MGFDCISFLNIAFLFTFHYLLNLLTMNPFVTSGLKNKTHHLKSCTRDIGTCSNSRLRTATAYI